VTDGAVDPLQIDMQPGNQVVAASCHLDRVAQLLSDVTGMAL